MGSTPAAAGDRGGSSDATIPVLTPDDDVPPSSAPAPPRTYSGLQVVQPLLFGGPVHPVLEDGSPVSVGETRRLVAEGNARSLMIGTLNSYLRTCGRIPLMSPSGPVDLNVASDAGHQAAADEDLIPVVCTFCNCAFCFVAHHVTALNPPRGFPYPRVSGPVTADLNTTPLVGPLCGGGGASRRNQQRPAPLVVCCNRHHFMVTMSMMNLPHYLLPVEWRRPTTLGVMPVAMCTTGGTLHREVPAPEGSSSHSRAPAPAPDA